MRAHIRHSFLLSCFLVLLLFAFSSLEAQIHGTPPSVTSFGFGPSNAPPGVAASVTSLGPNGFGNGIGNCCINPFFISRPPLAIDARRLHHHHHFDGVSGLIYVPYAVPYPVPYDDTGDNGSAEVDSAYSDSTPVAHDRGLAYRDAAAASKTHRPTPDPAAIAPPDPSDTPEPVAPQPATVLIYKDGHQSEVQNYAIVGETLFDFTDGRSHKILLADLDLAATQKANDDRGVDFRVPAKTEQVSEKK